MTEYERVNAIVEEICAVAPQAVKDSVDNNGFYVAILCAESYYRMKFADESNGMTSTETSASLFRRGKSIKFISYYLDMQEGAVFEYLNNADIPVPTVTSFFNASIYDSAIKRECGMSATYRRIADKAEVMGIELRIVSEDDLPIIMPKEKEVMQRMLDENMPYYDIAKHSGRSLSDVLTCLGAPDYLQGTNPPEIILDAWLRGRSLPFIMMTKGYNEKLVRDSLQNYGYKLPDVQGSYNITTINAAINCINEGKEPKNDTVKTMIKALSGLKMVPKDTYLTELSFTLQGDEIPHVKRLLTMGMSYESLGIALGCDKHMAYRIVEGL